MKAYWIFVQHKSCYFLRTPIEQCVLHTGFGESWCEINTCVGYRIQNNTSLNITSGCGTVIHTVVNSDINYPDIYTGKPYGTSSRCTPWWFLKSYYLAIGWTIDFYYNPMPSHIALHSRLVFANVSKCIDLYTSFQIVPSIFHRIAYSSEAMNQNYS